MDPVTILSVAAASFQFAELAVKSFSTIAKITKDFEDVPKRMRAQLNDIETSITRLRDFSTDLTRDASVSSLEPSRLGSLTSAVDNWLTTAADLESTLQGILNPSTASKRRRWQIAFKSLRQADDIEWQIQRLHSFSHEIWGELLRILLASQLQIKSDILDGETKISSNLRVAFQKLQDEQSNSKSHLVATAHEEGTRTRTTIDNITKSMKASFDELSLQANRDRDIIVGRVNAHVSEEIRELRALVSSATRGNHVLLACGLETSPLPLGSAHGGSVLTTKDNGLVIVPRDNAPAAPDPFIPVHHRHWLPNQSPPSCRCTMRIKRDWQVSKGLRLRFEAVKHVFPCSQSLEMQQFRSVSIHVELPRFMGPTIELSVATATTGTGYAFSQTFRCFPTVNRLSSPIFGEFDRLHSFFRDGPGLKELEKINIDAVRSHIRDLPRRLHSITATGAGSCRDKDEVGNTLLLETVYIMLGLQHRLPEVSVELAQLLDFLRNVGLDISSTGTKLITSPAHRGHREVEGHSVVSAVSAFGLNVSTGIYCGFGYATAQSFAMIVAQDAPESFPLYDYFKGFELEDYCSIDSSSPVGILPSAYYRSCRLQRAASFFCRNQALAPGLGSLESAVARKDMTELKSILRERSFDPRKYQWPLILANLELSGFQLAMDWQEGIEELLTKFSPTSQDIELAIHIDTPLSLKILRITWHRMGGPLDYKSIFALLPRTSDRARNQVLELMQESRLRLHQFAMVALNDSEKDRLCLKSHSATDWKTSEVWDTLIRQGCGVPLRYQPIQRDFLFCLLHYFGALEHFFQPSSQDGETIRYSSELLQKYCDTGFLEVDFQRFQPDPTRCDRPTAGQTPFLAFLELFDSRNYEGDASSPRFNDICLWFLDNGASAQGFGDFRPNLLFFLARSIFSHYKSQDSDDNGSSDHPDSNRQRKLWATALERCSADQSDACQCFCSVVGCLPSREFLQPPDPGCDRSRTTRAALDQRLLLWFELCPLSEEQKARYVEDSVRLEAFTRLGMTHTCCVPVREIRRSTFRFHELKLDDIKEIQFEESELKSHLDLIMEAYRSISREFEECSVGLSKWWKLLDGILPDLFGLSMPLKGDFESDEEYEHAVHDAEQDRAALEAQTLQSNGYGAMDFMDVIRLHLGEYLQDRKIGVAE